MATTQFAMAFAPSALMPDQAQALAKRARRKPSKLQENFAATPEVEKRKTKTQRNKKRKSASTRQPRSISHLGCYVPEQPPPRGMTPAAPTPAAPPRENFGNVTERQLRQLMDQTWSAAAIHGTDRVKAMLDALTHTTSPSPGSVPIGPQHGAAGSSNSSAGNTQPPARQQTAHGQHGQPQEGQNCEYPDLNRGQGNVQVPPTQPSYPPPRNGSEVWLGPQSAPTDNFAAMKAIFDNWHGQGNANTSPTQETGQSGRPMGDILLVTPTPAPATAVGTPTTATAVGTTVGQLGTNGHNTTGSSATNGNNAAQYTCTVGSLTAHVSEALKEKIWRSEYVDIFELLRKEGEGSDPKCHEACKLSAREKPCIAKTLANWSAGFRILSSIIGQKFPEKCCSLIAYQDVICGAYRTYGGTAWLEYGAGGCPWLRWQCIPAEYMVNSSPTYFYGKISISARSALSSRAKVGASH
ncbi:uncharacterized protein LOC115080210 isoform X1 [Rhinatrema bivittatum]|uniref:uncharacterized protein LOC115080210 isoform X1 n=1 Tax=Rhinatrema bivittatum TaxID=194408 RepID=UPI00112741D3|nr:uncharacterized protein LOC115080210 isoform X1 [Rhinatrema bivittatum]